MFYAYLNSNQYALRFFARQKNGFVVNFWNFLNDGQYILAQISAENNKHFTARV